MAYLDSVHSSKHGEVGPDDRASIRLRIAFRIELKAFRVVVCSVADKHACERNGDGYAQRQSGEKHDDVQGIHGGCTLVFAASVAVRGPTCGVGPGAELALCYWLLGAAWRRI